MAVVSDCRLSDLSNNLFIKVTLLFSVTFPNTPTLFSRMTIRRVVDVNVITPQPRIVTVLASVHYGIYDVRQMSDINDGN